MYRLTRVLATVLLLMVWSALGVAARDATIEGAPLFRETTRQPAAALPRLRASCALAMPKSILACWAAIIPGGARRHGAAEPVPRRDLHRRARWRAGHQHRGKA